jgi:hypothetical protein
MEVRFKTAICVEVPPEHGSVWHVAKEMGIARSVTRFEEFVWVRRAIALRRCGTEISGPPSSDSQNWQLAWMSYRQNKVRERSGTDPPQ